MKYIRIVDGIKYDGTNLKLIKSRLTDFEVNTRKVRGGVEISFKESGEVLAVIDLEDILVTYPGGFEIVDEPTFLLFHQEVGDMDTMIMAKGGDA